VTVLDRHRLLAAATPEERLAGLIEQLRDRMEVLRAGFGSGPGLG
jgi:hypothetical protein